MWGTAIRFIFAYLLTRRGKRTLAFVGTMLLCFVSAWLIDLRLYLSAAFTGILALIALFAVVLQTFRLHKDKRERERKSAANAEMRAERAEARSETINKAKAAVAEAAMGVGSTAADFVDATKAGVRGVGGRLSFWRRKNKTE